MYHTSCHLFDYCHEHENNEQIKNMGYIVETLKDHLYCLAKELNSIVSNQKYHEPIFFGYCHRKFVKK